MQRYFVDPEQFHEREVEITGDDVHHIVKVMRSETGEEIIVCDGTGRVARVRLSELSKELVRGEIVELLDEQRELPIRVTIGQGLPKADKMEWILQKGTELGAYAFFPFSSERTIVKLDEKKEGKKLERWRKIAKEAAEQAHRAIVPQLLSPVSYKQLLKEFEKYTAVAIAYEKEGGGKLSDVLPTLSAGDSLLVLIGPEGGFSEEEVRLAEQAGAKSVSLGPRILRTETASQYVLSAVSYHFE
ncbi:16S rRNA (uracil(1498)-N(3))-methyltransferase [Brevibacillus dissolubilis]|uniref:16S rRNA (uracil(1498)-N(3))-methyltransferase n=1 Tax=Brevibacillus dissolubilis TaxID=1844116 RepID=UPI0011172DFF|nr:16S rRNA (uracil(1498)-N(3))-methyltransferase [Brevibacillus dissolubilis]